VTDSNTIKVSTDDVRADATKPPGGANFKNARDAGHIVCSEATKRENLIGLGFVARNRSQR
jgi:hypothetical protein